MSNMEEAIAKAQLKGDAGVAGHQRRSIAYLDDRIFIALGGIAFLGLCVIWATAKSGWTLYGSFALIILMVIVWGHRAGKVPRAHQAGANGEGASLFEHEFRSIGRRIVTVAGLIEQARWFRFSTYMPARERFGATLRFGPRSGHRRAGKPIRSASRRPGRAAGRAGRQASSPAPRPRSPRESTRPRRR